LSLLGNFTPRAMTVNFFLGLLINFYPKKQMENNKKQDGKKNHPAFSS
jgi:hypothetical protein